MATEITDYESTDSESTDSESEDEDEEDESDGECECCDSKKLATKVEGLYVCEECNNFECGRCGISFGDTFEGNNWESRFKMCICVECCLILEESNSEKKCK